MVNTESRPKPAVNGSMEARTAVEDGGWLLVARGDAMGNFGWF